MKSVMVPAQITTVEDKITGSLSLSQLLLLSAPIFIGTALYAVIPPTLKFGLYKIVALALIWVLFGAAALRIRDKILLLWALVILRYNLRPRYYVYDKNDTHSRQVHRSSPENSEHSTPLPLYTHTHIPKLSVADLTKAEQLFTSPKVQIQFKPQKGGGVGVYLSEIK